MLYVFGVDALANYLTGQGFPDPEGAWRTLFPNTTHVIGKEILRFHALSWPGILRAAGLPLPKELRVHGHFTIDGEKISKTRGNTIDPIALVEEVGSDAVRFFLVRSKPFDRDGDFSLSRAKQQWNAELAGGLGNWAQRILALRGPTVLARPAVPHAEDAELLAASTHAEPAVSAACEDFDFLRALGSLVAAANRHLERVKPWVLAKKGGNESLSRLGEAIAAHRSALEIAEHCVAPVTPRSAEALPARLVSPPAVGPTIFPKLE